MTKKDYILIAKAVFKSYQTPTDLETLYSTLVGNLVQSLEKDNPRFDREKFIAACCGEK